MAGNDNSFEKQMLDFYGIEKIYDIFSKKNVNISPTITNYAYGQILFDLLMKKDGYLKQELEREKNKLQIELYNQLEIDRQNEKNI